MPLRRTGDGKQRIGIGCFKSMISADETRYGSQSERISRPMATAGPARHRGQGRHSPGIGHPDTPRHAERPETPTASTTRTRGVISSPLEAPALPAHLRGDRDRRRHRGVADAGHGDAHLPAVAAREPGHVRAGSDHEPDRAEAVRGDTAAARGAAAGDRQRPPVADIDPAAATAAAPAATGPAIGQRCRPDDRQHHDAGADRHHPDDHDRRSDHR